MEKFEFKGTPGKWIIEDAYLYGLPQLHKHVTIEGRFTNTPIATCYSEWVDKREMMANLSLICAAPLLLSALIKAVEFIEGAAIHHADLCAQLGKSTSYPFPNWYDEAKAAIQVAISQPENVKS